MGVSDLERKLLKKRYYSNLGILETFDHKINYSA